jgi:hypothetical protein
MWSPFGGLWHVATSAELDGDTVCQRLACGKLSRSTGLVSGTYEGVDLEGVRTNDRADYLPPVRLCRKCLGLLEAAGASGPIRGKGGGR